MKQRMSRQPTPLERAFELARSGDYASTSNVKAQLRAEGLDSSQVTGPALLRQLREIIAANRPLNDPKVS